MTEHASGRPIGIFDSGVGGLTAVKELIRILPHEDIVYFGDTARVPYGSHSRETIVRFAEQDLRYLLAQNVKAVLVACGTVSATALGELRAMTALPVIGVIEAASRRAAQLSRKKRVAVLATQASIRSGAYERALHGCDPSIEVLGKACPLFVPLIENGYADGGNPVTRQVIRDYLESVEPFGADTLILGCTHYPLLKDAIQACLPEVRIVEAGKEAALDLKERLAAASLTAERERSGFRRFVVSEKTDSFNEICELFLGEHIQENVEIVSVE